MNAANDYKIEVFVPKSHTARLMDELAGVGVGRIGNYDYCFAITPVHGYWRPLSGALPHQGEIGKISQVPEQKIEVNCRADQVRAALAAIRRAHPYEEPAVNIIELLTHSFARDR